VWQDVHPPDTAANSSPNQPAVRKLVERDFKLFASGFTTKQEHLLNFINAAFYLRRPGDPQVPML
jgi:hypothetical protein